MFTRFVLRVVLRLPQFTFLRLVLTGIGGVLAFSPVSLAQLTADQTLGTARTQIESGVWVRGELGDLITGGSAQGSHLFHSFSQFNINPGQRVYFANPAGISAILGRVTGADPSQILGTLGVDGGADLFLLNPQGILFGPDAQLDLAGSFQASTAASWIFEDGQEFSAVNPKAAPLLTIQPKPEQTYNLNFWGDITNKGHLEVASGKSLTLAGNKVTNQGYLGAPGGTLQVLGHTVFVLDGSHLTVSGETGGGTIRVGGGFQGQGQWPRSRQTWVSSQAQMEANAIKVGDGGEIILWSDESTYFAGQIQAQGGLDGGNGGRVETSSRDTLMIPAGAGVSTRSVAGQAGQWLLDPRNVTIADRATVQGTFNGSSFTPNNLGAGDVAPTAIESIVDTGVIVHALEGGSHVTITTHSNDTQAGNITVASDLAIDTSKIDATAAPTAPDGHKAVTLTLEAANRITVNPNVSIRAENLGGGTGAGTAHLNVVLKADANATDLATSDGGAIVLNAGAEIVTNGGDITLTGGAGAAVGTPAEPAGVTLAGVTLEADHGAITIQGQGKAGETPAESGGAGIAISGTNRLNGANVTLTGTGGAGGAGRDGETGAAGGDGLAVAPSAQVLSTGTLTLQATGGQGGPGGAGASGAGATAGAGGDGGHGLAVANGATLQGETLALDLAAGAAGAAGQPGPGGSGAAAGTAGADAHLRGTVQLTGNEVTLNGDLQAHESASLVVQPLDPEQNLRLGGDGSADDSTTLTLTDTELTQMQGGFDRITVGRQDGKGTATLEAGLTVNDPIVVRGEDFRLQGSNTATTFELTGPNAGLVRDGGINGTGSLGFEGVATIQGGTDATQGDRLVGDADGVDFVVTGPQAGEVNGDQDRAGTPDLTFSGIETLVGGATATHRDRVILTRSVVNPDTQTTEDVNQPLGMTVIGGQGDLTLMGDEIEFLPGIAIRPSPIHAGTLTLTPAGANVPISLERTGETAKVLDLSPAKVGRISPGFAHLTIATGGDIIVRDRYQFPSSVSLRAGGNLTLESGTTVTEILADGTPVNVTLTGAIEVPENHTITLAAQAHLGIENNTSGTPVQSQLIAPSGAINVLGETVTIDQAHLDVSGGDGGQIRIARALGTGGQLANAQGQPLADAEPATRVSITHSTLCALASSPACGAPLAPSDGSITIYTQFGSDYTKDESVTIDPQETLLFDLNLPPIQRFENIIVKEGNNGGLPVSFNGIVNGAGALILGPNLYLSREYLRLAQTPTLLIASDTFEIQPLNQALVLNPVFSRLWAGNQFRVAAGQAIHTNGDLQIAVREALKFDGLTVVSAEQANAASRDLSAFDPFTVPADQRLLQLNTLEMTAGTLELISQGNIALEGDILVRADRAILDIRAAGAVSTQPGFDLVATPATSPGATPASIEARIQAGGRLTLEGGAIRTAGGSLKLESAGNLTLATDITTSQDTGAAGNVTAIARQGNLSFAGTLSSTNYDAEGSFSSLWLESLNGDLYLQNARITGSSTPTSGNQAPPAGNILLNAKGKLSIRSSHVQTDGALGQIFLGLSEIPGFPDQSRSQDTSPQQVLIRESVLSTTNSAVGGTAQAGSIQVQGGGIDLRGTTITASTFGNQSGGSIEILATAQDQYDYDGDGMTDASVRMVGSTVEATVRGSEIRGTPGSITLGSRQGSLAIDSSTITTDALQQSGGSIDLGAVTIDLTRTQVSTGTNGAANAGNLTLASQRGVRIRQNSSIQVVSAGSGAAGLISISTSDREPGAGVHVDTASTIEASSRSSGTGGNIDIQADRLSVLGGAVIRATSTGSGTAGQIRLRLADSVQVAGVDQSRGGLGRSSEISVEAQGGTTAGNLTITTPQLTLQDGAILSAAAEGTAAGGNLILQTQNLRISSRAQVSASTAGTGKAGNITIDTRTLQISDGGQILAETSGSGAGGSIIARVPERIILGNGGLAERNPIISVKTSSNGRAGDILLITPDFILTETAEITATATRTATTQEEGGSISIYANRINLAGIVGVFAETNGQAAAGSLSLRPYDRNLGQGPIALDPSLDLILFPGSTISASTSGSGQGGDLSLRAPRSITVRGAGKLSVEASSTGNAGSITIAAPEVTLTDGVTVSASTTGSGAAGSIALTAHNLTLSKGATVSTNTSGSGQAGNIKVTVAETLDIDGGSIEATTSRESTGRGGSLDIDPINTLIRNGGRLAVDSQGQGTGGNIRLVSGNLYLDNGSISAITRSSDGGNITLLVKDWIQMDRGSFISTEAGTAGSGGNGGDINLTARFVIAFPASNSDIIANAFEGSGGNINISADGVFGFLVRSTDTPRLDSRNNLTASSRFGTSGRVEATSIDPSRGLTAIPVSLIDPSQLINNRCNFRVSAGQSKFTLAGWGGLAPEPDGQMELSETVDDLRLAPGERAAIPGSMAPAQTAGSVPLGTGLVTQGAGSGKLRFSGAQMAQGAGVPSLEGCQ